MIQEQNASFTIYKLLHRFRIRAFIKLMATGGQLSSGFRGFYRTVQNFLSVSSNTLLCQKNVYVYILIVHTNP